MENKEETLNAIIESIREVTESRHCKYDFSIGCNIEKYKDVLSNFLDKQLPSYDNEIIVDGNILRIHLEEKNGL